MRHRMLLLLLGALSASADVDSAKSAAPSGQALIAALQGAWCVTDDDGKTCWGYDRFFDGPNIEACGRFPANGQRFRAAAVLEVMDQTVCYTVTTSDYVAIFPIGYRFCAKVIEINDELQRYTLDGEVFTTYRVSAGAVSCA
jgi:hypothetical protein